MRYFIIAAVFCLPCLICAQNNAVQQANPSVILLNIMSLGNQRLANNNVQVQNRTNLIRQVNQEPIQVQQRAANPVPQRMTARVGASTGNGRQLAQARLRQKKEPIQQASRLGKRVPRKYRHFSSKRTGNNHPQHGALASAWNNVRALPCFSW